ncbi:MAG: LPS export ABC transporter periplasmic protein LptC [Acidobacteria bacterium]|nr:LPS export ABC transporter periplasmic protein LptC [Acidobacteriota bacterium]
MRRSTIIALLVLAALAASVVAEVLRSSPRSAEPVASQPPTRPDETAHLEGGFTWSVARDGKPLLDLRAASLVGTEGGTSFLEGVHQVRIYTEDGRAVLLGARRGRLERVGTAPAAGDTDLRVALEGGVVVQDPDGTELRTERIVYETATRIMRSDTPVTVVSPELHADAESAVYRPDMRLIEATGALKLELLGANPVQVDAARARYRLAAGEIIFDEPFRARMQGRTLLSGPGSLTLPREGRSGRFSGEGPVVASGSTATGSWQMVGTALRVDGSTANDVAHAELAGPASLVTRSSSRDGLQNATLRAREWKIDSRPGSSHATGGPGFDGVLLLPAAGGPERYLVGGEWIDLRGGAHGIESVVARNRVVLTGRDGERAEGAHVTWERREPSLVALSGSPARARRSGDLLEAPRLRLLRDRGLLVGEDGALAEIANMSRSGGALFGGDEPVRVRSQRVTIPDDPAAPIVFEGPVQAWQGQSTLRAENMQYLRAANRLIAEGGVNLRSEVGEGERRRTVRLQSAKLDYRAGERVAELTGGATYEEPSGRVAAREMTLRLAPKGGLENLEARGEVTLAGRGANGEADRLVWDGGEAGSVLLIGETRQVTLRSPNGEITRSSRVRYHPQDGRVESEGSGGRTLIEGKPAGRSPAEAEERKRE